MPVPVRVHAFFGLFGLFGLQGCTERITFSEPPLGERDAAAPIDAPPAEEDTGATHLSAPSGGGPRVDAAQDGRASGQPFLPPGVGGSGADASPGACRDLLTYPKLWYAWDRPTLLLAVDRSFSMLQRLGASSTRTQALQQALSPLLRTYYRSILMGYEEFPGRRTECGGGGACCAGRVMPPPQPPAAIESLLRCEAMSSAATGCFETSAEAPSHEAVRRGREFLGSSEAQAAWSRGRFILVLTDGDPGCTERSPEACDKLQAETTKAASEGVATHILAIGEEASKSACLEQAALRGGGKLLVGLTDVQVQQVLQELLSVISSRACRLTLPQAPANPEKLVLFFDNRIVPRSDGVTEGWVFEPGSQNHRISVIGSWCDRLRTSQVTDIDVVQSCSTCSPPGQCR